jgi:hypothetical protein
MGLAHTYLKKAILYVHSARPACGIHKRGKIVAKYLFDALLNFWHFYNLPEPSILRLGKRRLYLRELIIREERTPHAAFVSGW